MSDPFYIVGAGGFGRECLDAALASGLTVSAFLDEANTGRALRGVPVRVPAGIDSGTFVVAIADPPARRRLASLLEANGLKPKTIRHPSAVVSPHAHISDGAILLAHSYVSCDARLGPHAHVNYHASVGHDTVFGSYVTVLPGANIAGNVSLAEGATIGSNACVLPGLSVGRGATVGAGAVVTKCVPDGEVRKGVPAR